MEAKAPRTRFGCAHAALAIIAALIAASIPAQAQAAFFGVAHRGGRALGPENTLEVFQSTIALGATPWLETDSWETSDGVLVLHHDPDLCRTTNIETFPGFDCDVPANNPLGRYPRVGDFTLAELKALDVGSWFAPEFTGVTMPTLEEALLLVDGTGVPLLVDVKTPGQAPIIAEILTRTGVSTDNLIIWARQGFAWNEYHGVIPGIRQMTGNLPIGSVTDALLAARAAAGDLGVAVQTLGTTQALVDQIHSYGLLVYSIPAATGRDPIRDLIPIGVDAYHTPNEAEFATFLSEYPCIDRLDNEQDGLADFDGIDFDFDGIPEIPPDPGCQDPLGQTEIGMCQDQIDNDGDGLVDLDDPGCATPGSPSESLPTVPLLSGPGSSLLALTMSVMTFFSVRRRSMADRVQRCRTPRRRGGP